MPPAPQFILTTIGAARTIGGPPAAGSPLLLVFHHAEQSDLVTELNRRVRNRYPLVEQLRIVSVIDLHNIPRFMRPIAKLNIEAAYHQTHPLMPPGADPTDFVLIAPDWDGSVTRAFAMRSQPGVVGLAAIDMAWELRSTYLGPTPINAALELATVIARATLAP